MSTGSSALALGWKAPQGAVPICAVFAGLAALACAATGLLGLDHLPFPVCAFKIATGHPCPTCGVTRMFGRLFAGDWMGALAMNPLAAIGTAGLVLWGALDVALLPRGRSVRVDVGPGLARLLRWGAVAAVLANWAYLVAAGR